MYSTGNTILRSLFISTMLAWPLGSAHAQTAPVAEPGAQEAPVHEATVLEELVVTGARRRNEAAQETPLSITAIGAAQLERSQVSSVTGIAQMIPNIQMWQGTSSADSLAVFLRGFGERSSAPVLNPAVSVNIDGVYQSTVVGTLVDLFDVETVEVLKGPQGTLLGKNSPSGAINVTTRRPSGNFDGRAQLKVENYGRVEVRGLLNVPIIPDVLAAKASFLIKNGGNYIKNYDESAFFTNAAGYKELDPDAPHKRRFGGDDIFNARLGLLFTPSGSFDWYVVANLSRNRSPQLPSKNISVDSALPTIPRGYEDVASGVPLACSLYRYCVPFPKHSSGVGFRKKNKVDSFDVTSTAVYTTDPVSITSVTGYKHYNGLGPSDVDTLPVPEYHALGVHLVLDQFSQEFRLASNKTGLLSLDGRLDWILGGYYFYQKFNNDIPVAGFQDMPARAFAFQQNQKQHANSYALFAHMEYHITDPLAVTFGARQTWDDKRINSVNSATAPRIYVTQSTKNFSIEAGASYKFDRDKLLYARYAEGYRGGGFQQFPPSIAASTPYLPETVKSYELGFKSDWLDHHLRFNVDIFYSKYNNLQRPVVTRNGAQIIAITQNVASATTKGVEIETIVVPVQRLTLRGSLGYIKAEYNSYFADLIGRSGSTARDNSSYSFPFTPKWSGSAGADLILLDNDDAGKITTTVDYSYLGKRVLNPVDFPEAHVGELHLANASLRWDSASRKYSVTAYANNVFNKYYFSAIENTGGLVTSGLEGKPRTYGLSFSATF